MSDGIYSALSGALAQERTLAVVANNVANVGTTGFRGDRVAFGELVASQGAAGPSAAERRFVTLAAIEVDGSQGALQQTGNALDLALEGDGYFAVESPDGERYTRGGSFAVDGSGVLQTQSGLPVLSDGGTPLTIPHGARELRVGADGSLSADAQPLGKLKIVRFAPEATLSRDGAALFAASPGALAATDERTTVAQGFLEAANVNAIAGMNELITVSRAFEAFQKVIATFQQLDQRTARDVGGK